MATNTIYVTRVDAERIRILLQKARHSTYRGSPYLEKLQAELERAEVVEPQAIAPTVITMNTTAVLLDTYTGERQELTLVYPEDADVSQGRISVLAPIGAAMLGYQVGDTFTWETPGGLRSLHVEKIVSQPEASGQDLSL